MAEGTVEGGMKAHSLISSYFELGAAELEAEHNLVYRLDVATQLGDAVPGLRAGRAASGAPVVLLQSMVDREAHQIRRDALMDVTRESQGDWKDALRVVR